MEFKYVLKKLRTDANLTQVQLGDNLNLTQAAIARYEAGIGHPPFQQLIALAEYFNVSLDYLMGRSEDIAIQKEPSAVKEIAKRLYQHQDVLDMIDRTRAKQQCLDCILVNYLAGVIVKFRETR